MDVLKCSKHRAIVLDNQKRYRLGTLVQTSSLCLCCFKPGANDNFGDVKSSGLAESTELNMDQRDPANPNRGIRRAHTDPFKRYPPSERFLRELMRCQKNMAANIAHLPKSQQLLFHVSTNEAVWQGLLDRHSELCNQISAQQAVISRLKERLRNLRRTASSEKEKQQQIDPLFEGIQSLESIMFEMEAEKAAIGLVVQNVAHRIKDMKMAQQLTYCVF